jgi:hypothetical protein
MPRTTVSSGSKASWMPGASPADEEVLPGVKVKGSIQGRTRFARDLPSEGHVRRYILTSAQNNTPVHEALWLNLLALASHYDAELLVGTYSYNKSAYGQKAVKRGTERASDHEELWYDPQVIEHVCDEQVELAPGLVWCGELNILPTATHPLSQLEAYNGRCSNIVPHAKFSMQSVAAMKGEATKLNYASGTVTQRNYIQKKIGLLSEQHHGYGATLVEVCGDGSWFVRQLQATEEGVVRDLLLKAQDGSVTDGNQISAITWGDLHVRFLDPEVRRLAWGKGGMLDELRPDFQMMHDVIDFRSRNHHEAKDPLARYQKWKAKQESVSGEVREVVDFMVAEALRPWCKTVMVPSNHHEALERWLKEAKWQDDPVNAVFYHEAWLALLRGERDIFRWAFNRLLRHEQEFMMATRVSWLDTDETFVVAGVDLGQHGHMGINGARGNHKAFARLGRSTSTGHEHSAGIHLGNWVAGCSCLLRVGYNRGPSSWSHSHIVQYPEGTRTIVTMWKGRWRA